MNRGKAPGGAVRGTPMQERGAAAMRDGAAKGGGANTKSGENADLPSEVVKGFKMMRGGIFELRICWEGVYHFGRL